MAKKKGVSKSDIRKVFNDAILRLKQGSQNVEKALKNTEQKKQPKLTLGDWSGSLFDIKDLGKPFDRTELNDDMKNVVTASGGVPGVVGDYNLITQQGDMLAVQERAFRLRHQTYVRSAMHAAARRYGHGHDGGLFNRGILGLLTRISKLSKDT